MSKYDKFVIYKIYQPEFPELLYIGSTTNFSSRKSNHKKYCHNRVSKKYHYPIYQYIRSCGGIEKFNIEIVEKYPCKTKMEGLQREKELIIFHNAKLNTNKPIK
jgi:predicted GIY-YIG superfamily endonuclease